MLQLSSPVSRSPLGTPGAMTHQVQTQPFRSKIRVVCSGVYLTCLVYFGGIQMDRMTDNNLHMNLN